MLNENKFFKRIVLRNQEIKKEFYHGKECFHVSKYIGKQW